MVNLAPPVGVAGQRSLCGGPELSNTTVQIETVSWSGITHQLFLLFQSVCLLLRQSILSKTKTNSVQSLASRFFFTTLTTHHMGFAKQFRHLVFVSTSSTHLAFSVDCTKPVSQTQTVDLVWVSSNLPDTHNFTQKAHRVVTQPPAQERNARRNNCELGLNVSQNSHCTAR